MNNEYAQAILKKLMDWSNDDDKKYRPHFQTMAKYKYDDYQQYLPGMRFIERFALWLDQFNMDDRKIALEFIKDKLVYISVSEMNNLVNSAYQDYIKNLLVKKISEDKKTPEYKLKNIIDSKEFQVLKRQSLFLGLSDGSKTDLFRRYNFGNISHEQVYQTYELSNERIKKMKDELKKDLQRILKREPSTDENKFKMIFLLDDFSASGKSYVSWDDKENKFKGKIPSLFINIKAQGELDLSEIKVYVILYICTNQALDHINSFDNKFQENNFPTPILHPVYLLNSDIKLILPEDSSILALCNNDSYYDGELLEDEHTKKGGGNVKQGFGDCSIPLVLSHNTPNNSISLLWAYDESDKFKGLFPRIPRHKEVL